MGTQVGGGVAYWAHVGGFVFGMAATWLLFRSQTERDANIPPFPPPPYRY
jgi:membrane associated rhomboid family serine protease